MNIGSLSQQAYDRIEALIVTTRLAPGSRTTLRELEQASGYGRTPVHDAVKRLATARLVHVQPRSGLRIAPVDLEEERLLLPVRIEMEAIACKLAAQQATDRQRQDMRLLVSTLQGDAATMTLADFNVIDIRLNRAILDASRQVLLGNTLLPLQTLHQRSGWLFHTRVAPDVALEELIGSHCGLLDAVVGGDPTMAERIVRSMLSSVYDMLQSLEEADVLGGEEIQHS